MSEILRTFLAIEIPDSVKETIASLEDELRSFNCRVSWAQPQTVHLTLKFLGDTESELIDLMSDAFTEALKGFPAFELETAETGVFGGNRPRVLWLGLKGDEILQKISSKLDSAAAEFGFPQEEKKFHPHLTLGRVKDPRGTFEMIEHFKNITVPAQKFITGEITFFKSELHPRGAIHTPLKKMRLGQ